MYLLTLTITCTCACCFDGICGAQDLKISCSFADSLSAQHRQCRFVCCAGVMSLGSAAEEVPSEVSASDYVSCTDTSDCDLRVLTYQMSACDLFEHMCV